MTADANPRRPLADHLFFFGAAIAAALIVCVGFARSYYFKFLFGTPGLPWLLHLHGALMTSWLLLFFAQIYLIASHRPAVHKRLGIFGAALAACMVVVVVTVLVHSAIRDLHDPAQGPRSIIFLGSGLADISVFSVLVGAAIALRRRGDCHKRLMLLATVSILVAAIARIPLSFIEHGGLSMAILLADLCIASMVAVDTFRHRRFHPAFAWGGLLSLYRCIWPISERERRRGQPSQRNCWASQ